MSQVKKVLITGVAGLFGANFSRYLLNAGYQVVGIDDLSGGYEDFLPKSSDKFTFVKADLGEITQPELDRIFVEHNIKYVYHFAAFAACGLSPFIREFSYRNNLMASVKLINSSVRNNVEKFVFTSSMTVYGEGTPPFTEEMLLRPETSDPYAIAKHAVELDLFEANKRFGLKYNIVRPHNVHGIYQNIWDRYRNVIGIFIRKAINNEDLTIYGDGTQVRAFSDIDFYMAPLERLIYKHENHTFNIGADQPTTILDLAKAVQKAAKRREGKDIGIQHLEPRQEVHLAWCDHTKAKTILNFKDGTDLDSLIDKMYAWALTQPNREVKKMKYEIEQGIYSYWK